MKWLKRVLIAVAVLLAAGAALPFFIPLDGYIPRIEREASARLGEPVSIKGIKVAVLPLPHVAIEGITVGKTGDIKLGKVKLIPDLVSLLQSTRVIKSIEIDSLALTQKAIGRIPAWAKPDAAGPPPVRVTSIRLNNARVDFGRTGFGPFDARVNLDGSGEPVDASITTQDGKLKALLRPGKPAYLLDVRAKAWTLPLGPPLVFDELIVNGTTTFNDASLDQVSAKLYHGTAVGKTAISWRKGLKIEGSFDVSQLELRQVASMLSPGTQVSGKLDARPAFSASAVSVVQLTRALRLESPFTVRNGAIHGVDIQKAATDLVRQGTSGGETRFEQLSGHLVMKHGSYRFTRLKIASGTLAADGNVSISPKRELSGRINAQVSAVGTSAGVPLNVGGTLDAPLLYPTAGTMAGAAVGTAILGPGVGTSIGAKIGGWAEGLFGDQDDAKPKPAK